MNTLFDPPIDGGLQVCVVLPEKVLLLPPTFKAPFVWDRPLMLTFEPEISIILSLPHDDEFPNNVIGTNGFASATACPAMFTVEIPMPRAKRVCA